MVNKNKLIQFVMHGIIIIGICITAISTQNVDKPKDGRHEVGQQLESVSRVHTTTKSQYKPQMQEYLVEQVLVEADEIEYKPAFTYSKDWSDEDSYMLAKIAMAEAEGENTQTKTLIIMAVLNRVQSDAFPNTILEVIQQKVGKVHQFSPLGDGRWETVEPNEDCWEALRVVQESQYDYSDGALYFESCVSTNNWHSRNLTFLYQSDNMRFYK